MSVNGDVCGVESHKIKFFLAFFTLARSETRRKEVLDYSRPLFGYIFRCPAETVRAAASVPIPSFFCNTEVKYSEHNV